MTQEVCWPLHKYRKGQYSSTHNARCHCSQNSTASVASYPALTFFLNKVRLIYFAAQSSLKISTENADSI